MNAIQGYLSAGGDIDARTMDGDTLLTNAVTTGASTSSNHYETIRFLLERGADPNVGTDSYYPLHLAGDAQSVELLLAHGARIDAQTSDSWGATALMTNLERNMEIMLVLLRHGASLDVRDRYGRNILETAQRRLAIYVEEGFMSNRFPSHIAKYESMVNLLTAVRDAGSYKRYLRERAVALLKLRYLCLAGRATAPAHLVRCFGSPPISTDAARSKWRASGAQLPDEVFEHVLSFWNDT